MRVAREQSMRRCCLVVCDNSRARFLVSRMRSNAYGLYPPRMTLDEQETLVSPENRLSQRDLFSETKPGGKLTHGAGAPGRIPVARRGVPARTGRATACDDHRMEHDAEFQRRFARHVVERASYWVRETGAERLVLVAPPKALGYLRAELAKTPAAGVVEVLEVIKDLSRLDLDDIRDHVEPVVMHA